ncbi:MAG: CopG family transcriptional regulator [Planctomycetes bacterium]|nr:CopG family transcriptional regulator [Planctomycetota bacterium]
MIATKRATVYFDAAVHKALRLKAATLERSISDIVNDAVRAQLSDDADDLDAIQKRTAEPRQSFESFVKNLKRSGKI